MTTVVSAPNTAVNGTAEADWISSSGDGVTISASSGNDYVISRGNSCIVYGGNDNDTLVILPSSAGATAQAGGGGRTGGGAVAPINTEVRGNAGSDDIVIVHDSVVAYGDVGNDYMTVKLYENAGDALTSLHEITLTGGDGRDTFSFNSSLPAELETMSAATDTATSTENSSNDLRIEAVITDFSSTAHLCYDSTTSYFIYSIITDPTSGEYTDIVLRGNSGRIQVTLQGITDINDIVYATAVRFNGASLETSYLGEVISNYSEDMSAIPAGITYSNYTVYVSDSYARNVWLMGTDEVNKTSTYRNITARTLDARNSTRSRTLVGNTNANAIYAGNGGDSLWGYNNTNDTMFGGNGMDMFWYGLNDGNDCIRNFVFGSASNSDIVNFYTGGINEAYRDSGTVHVVMSNGSELIMPNDYGVDTEIQYSTDATNISRAKIGEKFSANTFTYDSGINLFMGCSNSNTLTVDDSRKNNIWLDGRFGQSFYEISCIDATDSTGDNQLAGANNTNITITGGAGNSSLWGGNGRYSNDSLIGGTGAEMFFFGKYEGSDTINGAGADDTIRFYNGSISDITSVDSLTGGGIQLNFNNGDYTLALESLNADTTFSFADGGNFTYNKGTWTQK